MTRAQAIAKNYEQARREYVRERSAILNSTGSSLQGEASSRGQWSGNRTTEAKAAKLESLERFQWVKEMHAVEHARDRIGASLPDEMRRALQAAIMLNCTSGRRYPFERLYTVGISRRTFYRFRQRFFDDIAAELSRTWQNEQY